MLAPRQFWSRLIVRDDLLGITIYMTLYKTSTVRMSLTWQLIVRKRILGQHCGTCHRQHLNCFQFPKKAVGEGVFNIHNLYEPSASCTRVLVVLTNTASLIRVAGWEHNFHAAVITYSRKPEEFRTRTCTHTRTNTALSHTWTDGVDGQDSFSWWKPWTRKWHQQPGIFMSTNVGDDGARHACRVGGDRCERNAYSVQYRESTIM